MKWHSVPLNTKRRFDDVSYSETSSTHAVARCTAIDDDIPLSQFIIEERALGCQDDLQVSGFGAFGNTTWANWVSEVVGLDLKPKA